MTASGDGAAITPRGAGTRPAPPSSRRWVMIGAGLLWFGWFGFNAGSALAANRRAAEMFVNTLVATCAAMLGRLVTERVRDGHASDVAAGPGVVALAQQLVVTLVERTRRHLHLHVSPDSSDRATLGVPAWGRTNVS